MASQSPLSALGKACTTASNHLDPHTRRFKSDCDAQTFCSSALNGTCVPRQCRREEFPLGYNMNQIPPALCPVGSFCPDEGDACRPLVAVGQPSDYHNFGGSVCLHSVCTHANVTEKEPCIFELSTYSGIDPAGMGFKETIARDNCQTAQFFCDTATRVCGKLRLVGQQCQYHRDCQSYNCLQSTCASPPEEPLKVALWQYGATTLAAVLAMAAVCFMLIAMHRRHRLKHYLDIRNYCDEQTRLRQSAFGLRSQRQTLGARNLVKSR
ncbi:hypothetical protein B0F90DRAFT_1315284 [Multifurca ochricompacta]|uniref:Uncharacterized protein n=1 Tax=Multifurca ochricompacta TaxID=376703 RepID=A0AAD4QNL8_9AGAM|nr:hypothetical protein B0F90DRAFT_1315284 [Multifurca ochricompacta]